MACTVDFVPEGLPFCYLGLSYLYPSLLWTRTFLIVACRVCFYSLSSLPLLGYDRVFCIHEVLSRMDKFSHKLRFFFINLWINRSELTPLWNATNNSLSSTSSTVRASLLKRVMKDRRLSFFPCSMVNKLDEERLCLCPPMKLLTNNLLNSLKELTEFGGILLKYTRAFKGGWKGSAHYLI